MTVKYDNNLTNINDLKRSNFEDQKIPKFPIGPEGKKVSNSVKIYVFSN